MDKWTEMATCLSIIFNYIAGRDDGFIPIYTVPERQRNTPLLQRNTNKNKTEHSLFSSTYSHISSSINCFSNSWCISRGMWIKNIFIHLYHQSKSIYDDQGLRNNSLKLRYDLSCFWALQRYTKKYDWIITNSCSVMGPWR